MDIAIRGDGYFFVKGPGEPSLSRRGDLAFPLKGRLKMAHHSRCLITNLQPIQVPAYRKMKVTDNGEVIIEPLGSEPGTKQTIGHAWYDTCCQYVL